jgi:hypothetical protein
MENGEEMGLDFADVASQFTEFEDQWVAINESGNKIVASGASIFEVDKEAERQGYENVFLFKVPRSDHGFAPLAR